MTLSILCVDLWATSALAQTVTPWVSNTGMFGGMLGAAIGIFGGVYGAAAGILAPRGAAKGLIFAMHWLMIAAGVALLGTGIVAWTLGQPYGVWYAFGLSGFILTIVTASLTPVLAARYREAEQRRLQAEDFRHG